MKQYKIPNTDLDVSRIAYGTALMDIDCYAPDFIARATMAIQAAYDHGVTLFDTANVYGQGKSELALGECFKQSPGLREKIVLQSKCGMRLPERWTVVDPVLQVNHSCAYIIRCVEESLERLRTDRLDILLLHLWDPLLEPEEVALAFDRLQQSGKVRHFGVCNYTIPQLDLLRKQLRRPLAVHQIFLGLHGYAPIAGTAGGILEYCRLNEIGVQAHSALRGAYLQPLAADASPQLREFVKLLSQLAQEKAVHPSAIALAWLLHHPARIVPIIGSCNPQWIAENCTADPVVLSDEEWYAVFRSAAGIQSEPVYIGGQKVD